MSCRRLQPLKFWKPCNRRVRCLQYTHLNRARQQQAICLISQLGLFCFKIRQGTATSRLFSRCSETQKQLKGHLLMFCYPSKKATMHAVCLALSVGLSSKESTPWKMLPFKNARKKGSKDSCLWGVLEIRLMLPSHHRYLAVQLNRIPGFLFWRLWKANITL